MSLSKATKRKPSTRARSRGAQRRPSTKDVSKLASLNYRALCSGLIRLSLLAAVVAAGLLLWPQINRPVEQVQFSGSVNYVDQQKMREIVSAHLGDGLFRIDMQALDRELERVAWVYAVEIKKVWPKKLEIEIEEQQPVASWGEQGYLAASGVLVRSEILDDLAALPSLNVKLAEPHEALELFYGLNTVMTSTGVALSELNQSEFGSWSMTMENGSQIKLGKEALLKRMHRVMHAWQRLLPDHVNDIEAVDARYPNGIAVKYRQEVVQEYMQHSRGSNI